MRNILGASSKTDTILSWFNVCLSEYGNTPIPTACDSDYSRQYLSLKGYDPASEIIKSQEVYQLKRFCSFTRVDNRTNLAKEGDIQGEFLKSIAVSTSIPIDVKAAETSSKGKSILLMNQTAKVSKAYTEFTKEA